VVAAVPYSVTPRWAGFVGGGLHWMAFFYRPGDGGIGRWFDLSSKLLLNDRKEVFGQNYRLLYD
jgi:hypothetical protein